MQVLGVHFATAWLGMIGLAVSLDFHAFFVAGGFRGGGDPAVGFAFSFEWLGFGCCGGGTGLVDFDWLAGA